MDQSRIDEARAAPVSSVLGILLGTREFLTDENHWCQDDPHKNGRHCLVSAIGRALGNPATCAYTSATDHAAAHAVASLTGPYASAGGRLASFNDTHSHPEVLALLDRAIAKELSAVRS